ncbi:MAG: biosynthetic arginine decarboxylase [Helicobacteraceae bacterium]|jgi:arginine decarboxylase|nr:biosynthetic arginine decarboxylase [Helicobacteraceae bacterium]
MKYKEALNDYGLSIWGGDNFIIENGKVCVNSGARPSILDMVNEIRTDGYRGPLLLRFPHLVKKQIHKLYSAFNRARKEYKYGGRFQAVFPLKVNQFPGFVKILIDKGENYGYGLEAGSKAELILAMAYNREDSPITVNGFKDEEMISLGFIAKEMGHDVTLTIEGIGELETILDMQQKTGDPMPKIGIRIRLHTAGMGIWGKSGGINAKFGLTSAELIRAVSALKKAGQLNRLTMIHFHIGSQMEDIAPLKRALREAGNIYAELRKMGAINLRAINLGGGLAVEYSQDAQNKSASYSLQEVANDVVFLLKSICENKGVEEPDIFTESGRLIAASHAVLVAPVLELFTQEYTEKALNLKEKGNPPLVSELYDLYRTINEKNAAEYLHDSLDHMESLLTLFDLGYIDLQDRSNSEVLVHLIIRKALDSAAHLSERDRLQQRIQEKYLVNFSLFQSMPDYWGLGQEFPIMPLDRLGAKPTRSASLWDITCDSDGEITFKTKRPLFLHDVDLFERNYFLAFFLVGAYQEALGMRHNLFSHPTEAVVDIDDEGYHIRDLKPSASLLDILDDIDYDITDVQKQLKKRIERSELIPEDKRQDVLAELYLYLSENGYLKTTRQV